MKARLLVFSIILLWDVLLRAQAPPWAWAREANSGGAEYAWDISADTVSHYVYIGGTFNGNLSAAYGSAFSASYGQDDGFLAKYTSQGAFQWAIKVGGASNDQVKSVAVDPVGDVYICGYFSGTADFDPSAATFTLSASGAKDGFLAKYSSSGVFLWAVTYGGSGDDEPWKLYADANGIYVTGSYANAPATFNSYSSAVTKNTTSTNSNEEMFGAKYSPAGIIQWVISGGGAKADCGYNVVADVNNAYFIGRYDDDITFRNPLGIASASLQAQQSNKQQVFIIACSQAAGAFAWQTNITCNQGGNDVVGWGIAQDDSSLYVSGYLEGDINFRYPSPALTQNHIGGGGFDIFLAKLSKAGTFAWRAAVTGSGNGEQAGRSVATDRNGNVILSGYFMNTLNYASAGGPILTASAKDIFVASYSNSGTFQWATKAGNTGDDFAYGLTVDGGDGIYITGSHNNGAIFGTYSLTAGGGTSNIYVARLGCDALGNNTISASQTVCSGNAPSSLTGSLPAGSGPYNYVWEKSLDNIIWTNATGTYTSQNYTPPPLTTNTYYRRKVQAIGVCASTLISMPILISVDAPPTTANAGASQTTCASSAMLSANTPIVGTGHWSVITGTASVSSSNSPLSPVTGLSSGSNQFVWVISNGACPASSDTVTITKDVSPTIPDAGTGQTICSSTATLNANVPVTGTALWTLVSGTGFFLNPNLASSVITGLSVGNNRFAWTISNGVCAPLSDTVLIIRDEMPSAAIAGADKIICSSSDQLSANLPSIGTGAWSVVSGSSSVAVPGSPTVSVSNLSTGLNSFVWSISNGVCPASLDTMHIQVDAKPTAPDAGNDRAICSDHVALQGNAVTVGTGSWSLVSGSGIFEDTSLNHTTVSSLGIGTTVFRWSIQNGTCPVLSDEVAITRDAPPDAALAGSDLQTDYPVASLAAVSPIVGTGLWSVVEGPAEINDPSSPAISVTNLGIGTNVFRWTVRNGVCPESTDDLLVELSPLKIPNAFSPNGDGLNEAFVVPGLEYYDHVKFSVFNRWSALLYENNNYKNEWTGLNSSREKLADDTYYYTLELPSIDKKYTGFIIIKTDK